MTELAHQILRAVQDDHTAITELAGAIARGDADGVRTLLSVRGVDMSAEQIGAVISQAGRAGAGSNWTTT